MQAIPLARASLLRPIFDFLEQTEVELGARLESARALLRDPAALVPVAMGGALFEEAERRSGRTDIGLRAGALVPVLEYSDWGELIARAATVGGYISALVTHARRFNSGNRFWAIQRGGEVWLHQRFSSLLVRGRRVASEFGLMLVLNGLRLATGPEWRPLEIHLEGAAPPHAAELAALASKRICFEQPYMALVFPSNVLACRFPPKLVASLPAGRAPVPATSFEGSIRHVVEALVRVGSAELGTASEATHMSERSLQRRLAECGLSFTRLVEEVRFDSARRLLSDPTVKIVEISAELGYTDSANFTRAFRRWSGVSPQAYRRSA
jgi:AraC-like DNA-binding protein